MVVYDDTSVEPVRVFDSGVTYRDPETFGEFHLSYRTGDIVSPHLDSSEPLALEVADFVASIRSGQPARSTPALARSVVAMIESTESSLLARGAVCWPTVSTMTGLLVSATPLPSGVSSPAVLGPASPSRASAASGSSFLASSHPQRDYWRRRLLAGADMLALLVSFEARPASSPRRERRPDTAVGAR